jgi:hypothetical protein
MATTPTKLERRHRCCVEGHLRREEAHSRAAMADQLSTQQSIDRQSIERLSVAERATVKLYVKLQHEYVKAGAGRASLSVGDVVAVVDEKDTGWYSGFAISDPDHTPHWFPKSYATEIKVVNKLAEPEPEAEAEAEAEPEPEPEPVPSVAVARDSTEESAQLAAALELSAADTTAAEPEPEPVSAEGEAAPEPELVPDEEAAAEAEAEAEPVRTQPTSILKPSPAKNDVPPPCLDGLELEGDAGRKALIGQVQAALRTSHPNDPSPDVLETIEGQFALKPQEVAEVFAYFRELMGTFKKPSIREQKSQALPTVLPRCHSTSYRARFLVCAHARARAHKSRPLLLYLPLTLRMLFRSGGSPSALGHARLGCAVEQRG